jgi:hypothetical protein
MQRSASGSLAILCEQLYRFLRGLTRTSAGEIALVASEGRDLVPRTYTYFDERSEWLCAIDSLETIHHQSVAKQQDALRSTFGTDVAQLHFSGHDRQAELHV